MTRVTDFGRKRTHVQAGFAQDEPAQTIADPGTSIAPGPNTDENPVADGQESSSNPPAKKKRKRTPKSKRDGYAAQRAAEAAAAAALNGEVVVPSETQPVVEANAENSVPEGPVLTRIEKKQKRNLARRMKVMNATEQRRLKRISQKDAQTICFACREKGHAAKDCPTQKGDAAAGAAKGTVGICYRCNSQKHTLSRCKKPADPANPLPYATCFVCNSKGHLASGCPMNKAKGVYPNGGCCKLCGDTSHLAKDCGIREKVKDAATVLGTGREAGADEDDFHTIKRTTIEIDRNEKKDSKLKEMLDLRTGALSGAIKATGIIAKPAKKVVVFK